jgi:ribosomal protein S18 acetylase RimI-like enzyme
MLPTNIHESPWDQKAFGIPCYEIDGFNPESGQWAQQHPGHYTTRVSPLANKQVLEQYGFYYCDTLIEPFCSLKQFVAHQDKRTSLSKAVALEDLLPISHQAFTFGRFHKDFNISKALADKRYDQWLTQLHNEGKVIGLFFDGKLVGFIAVDNSHLILHAMHPQFRGQGLAKFLWSAVCAELFASGLGEISSSISAANLAAVNLYSSLGFRFRNAQDIYHRLTK